MDKETRYPTDRAAEQHPTDLFFFWPAIMAAAATDAVAASLNEFVRHIAGSREQDTPELEPAWTTPHHIRLELGTMRLRDFSTTTHGVPTLVCAPYALHCATIADFAPGHSLVDTLRRSGAGRVHVTDWRSATSEMQSLSIDNYFADLNVAVDELEPPVDLIGLCQGGWLALAFAARFPQKVRRLVLAGAPIDIAAGESKISNIATRTPLAVFEQLVQAGGGRVLGKRALDLWESALTINDERLVLQIPGNADSASIQNLLQRFSDWYDTTIDLPGRYYLQVVSWLFKENQLAEGKFVALGRRIDLKMVRHPIFLLAGRDDDLVASDQILGTARLIGTPKTEIETATEPCGHLSLFLGAETLKRHWTRIARWLAEDQHNEQQAA
jgi:poly(3-hydroxyalkanoate) synthetase